MVKRKDTHKKVFHVDNFENEKKNLHNIKYKIELNDIIPHLVNGEQTGLH